MLFSLFLGLFWCLLLPSVTYSSNIIKKSKWIKNKFQGALKKKIKKKNSSSNFSHLKKIQKNLKVKKKDCETKKSQIPSESLEKWASCDVFAFPFIFTIYIWFFSKITK